MLSKRRRKEIEWQGRRRRREKWIEKRIKIEVYDQRRRELKSVALFLPSQTDSVSFLLRDFVFWFILVL